MRKECNNGDARLLATIASVLMLGALTGGAGAHPVSQPYLVKDIRPGSGGSTLELRADVDGTLFFIAHDDSYYDALWKTDGTEAGTVRVKHWSGYPFPKGLAAFNGALYFYTENNTYGREVWRSDGTEASTVMLKDINPGAGDSISYWAPPPVAMDGMMFFRATDGINGWELWKSDGTEAGTVMVKDINPGDANSGIDGRIVPSNGMVFFSAGDGVHGGELWKSDGTEAGTVMVKDLRPGSRGSSISNLTNVNGTLFFVAYIEDNLWSFPPVSNLELFKSDGTEAGTHMVKDIYPGMNPSSPSDLTAVGDTLFFVADDGIHGRKLWKSDGTEAGTVMVKDINPGAANAYISSLTSMNGLLYFAASDGVHGHELWRSDGTEEGTVMVKNIRANGGSTPRHLVYANRVLYFNADDGIHGRELWMSDGTEAGTVMVADIRPGSSSSSPEYMIVSGDRLYFRANDGVHGVELWALPIVPASAATGHYYH